MIYSARFLQNYHRLPHTAINRAFAALTRARRPGWLVQLAIERWIAREQIEMSQFEARAFASLEDFFLRALRPGARPFGAQGISPVDGRVVAAGAFDREATLQVKGHRLSLARIINGPRAEAEHALPLTPYNGGSYVSLFLSPRGYHHVHMPEAGVLRDVRWLPGRYFPQNEHALRLIHDVYEQNERLVLRIALDSGPEILLVMVGASLIGGIQLLELPRAAFTQRAPLRLERRIDKGARLGHFTFGSTVIVVAPAPLELEAHVGDELLLGQPLWSATSPTATTATR